MKVAAFIRSEPYKMLLTSLSIKQRLGVVCLCTMPMPVLAFDPSGAATSLVLVLVLALFIVLNTLLQGLFYFAGCYQQRPFAMRYVALSALIPISILGIGLISHRSLSDLAFTSGVALVAIALSLLPMQWIKHTPTSANQQWILPLAALFVLLLSLVITPLALVSVLIAHVSLTRTSFPQLAKKLSWFTLVASYALLGYWLYQVLTTVNG